jgi:dTDP-4-amino-4,6-dideoxygalactose transaminase
MSEKLAIDGGTPVRTKPFPITNVGEAVIGDEEKAEVLDVLNARSPFRFYGPDPQKKADQLEAEFKKMTGKKHALAVTSGTAALKVSLLAAGVGPGDEVIVPSVTFIATAGVVVACHARPVFAEVGEDLGLDPADVERRITKRTKAIIPVHLLGGAVDMDPIVAIGKKHGIIVLEDCAQSTGACYKGKAVGSFGDINAFSMQFQKVITAGEGGVIVMDDDKLYDRAIRAHDHGGNRWEAGEPEDAFCGEVYRLNEMSAAFGLAQFRKLQGNLDVMRKYNKIVRAEMAKLGGMPLRSLVDPDGATGQTITVVFETKEIADRFREAYGKEGVPATSLYGGKLVLEHPQIMNQRMVTENGPFNSPLYDGPIEYRVEDYPQSVNLLNRAVWFWFSPVMGDEECDDIIKALHKVHAAVMG